MVGLTRRTGPAAGVKIDVHLVRRLLGGQFPQWAGLPLEPGGLCGMGTPFTGWVPIWRCVCRAVLSAQRINPYVPDLPGQDWFAGRLLHVAHYRSPHQHAGERVVVVGAGNSAVQVGYELAQVGAVVNR